MVPSADEAVELEAFKKERTALNKYAAYPKENKAKYDSLFWYTEFVEQNGLCHYFPESYFEAWMYIKEIVLKAERHSSDLNYEYALYKWLKICVNTENDPNNDFFIEKWGIDKEKEVRAILFENNNDGPLRSFWSKKEWQIRLTKLRSWFLKRYDRKTASALFKNIGAGWTNKLELWYPRLAGAIFIGFLPLLTQPEVWTFPLKLKTCYLAFLIGFFLLVSCGYFFFEYRKVTDNKDIPRPLKVFLWGCIYSLLISLASTAAFSKHFLEEEAKKTELPPHWECIVFPDWLWFHPSIVLFFASCALLIGIFIQIFWEEKTVTEPL